MRAVDLEGKEWAALVRGCEQATPFHHPAWGGLLAETYGFRVFGLVRGDENGISDGLPVIEVALPGRRRRRWVSLPFTDHCAPLSTRGSADGSLAADLEAARQRAGIGRLEIRAPLVADPRIATAHARALRHVLPLSADPEEVLHRVRYPQVRRKVGKALREGVSVRTAETEAEVARVYYRLHLMTRRRLGIPVQPVRYFRLLWRRLLEPGLGRLFLAYSGGEAIAGAVVLRLERNAIYKYSASDPSFHRLRPNNLLVWRAIQWSVEGGATSLDFGRCEFGNEGLRTFKSGWGAREETLTYTTFGALGSGLEAPPKFLARAIRRSPALVCRAVGELFYKYAA